MRLFLMTARVVQCTSMSHFDTKALDKYYTPRCSEQPITSPTYNIIMKCLVKNAATTVLVRAAGQHCAGIVPALWQHCASIVA